MRYSIGDQLSQPHSRLPLVLVKYYELSKAIIPYYYLINLQVQQHVILNIKS